MPLHLSLALHLLQSLQETDIVLRGARSSILDRLEAHQTIEDSISQGEERLLVGCCNIVSFNPIHFGYFVGINVNEVGKGTSWG